MTFRRTAESMTEFSLGRSLSCRTHRQRSELDELRRQLQDNSALAGRALIEELEKTREEQERRHQVKQSLITALS